MRILYFHQHFSTPAGAGGTRSYEMARALIERGHEVTMVCGSYRNHNTGLSGKPKRWIRRGNVQGIKVIEICLPCSNYDSLLKRSIIFVAFAFLSTCIACFRKYDLLLASSTPLTAALPGIAMRILKPGKPFVFEVRDLWPELPRAMGVIKSPIVLWSLSLLEWFAYQSARACIGLSPGIVKGIRKRLRKDKPVAMIPNGCDLDLFCPTTEGQNTVAHEQKHGHETISLQPAPAVPQANDHATASSTPKFRAVFTGAHGIANGLHAVLDAAAILKGRNRRDIQIVFIGDGRRKPELMKRAKEEQLDNCIFLDPIPKIELGQRIREFDIGLMILANVPAFYYGTSPNKFFDYISCGLPVVNNYPGWLADLIQEHRCGIAVEPENPTAFADALERLADHPDSRREMGDNARKLAEQKFDRNLLAQQFCDFLETQKTHKHS